MLGAAVIAWVAFTIVFFATDPPWPWTMLGAFTVVGSPVVAGRIGWCLYLIRIDRWYQRIVRAMQQTTDARRLCRLYAMLTQVGSENWIDDRELRSFDLNSIIEPLIDAITGPDDADRAVVVESGGYLVAYAARQDGFDRERAAVLVQPHIPGLPARLMSSDAAPERFTIGVFFQLASPSDIDTIVEALLRAADEHEENAERALGTLWGFVHAGRLDAASLIPRLGEGGDGRRLVIFNMIRGADLGRLDTGTQNRLIFLATERLDDPHRSAVRASISRVRDHGGTGDVSLLLLLSVLGSHRQTDDGMAYYVLRSDSADARAAGLNLLLAAGPEVADDWADMRSDHGLRDWIRMLADRDPAAADQQPAALVVERFDLWGERGVAP